MEILEDRDQLLANYQAGWLAHYRRTGEIDCARCNHSWRSSTPPGEDIYLAGSRLLLMSSVGAHLPGLQQPFDAGNPLGGDSTRRSSASTPSSELAIAHGHYDRAAIEQDPQVLVPLATRSAWWPSGRAANLLLLW
jgi:hypothetical protein